MPTSSLPSAAKTVKLRLMCYQTPNCVQLHYWYIPLLQYCLLKFSVTYLCNRGCISVRTIEQQQFHIQFGIMNMANTKYTIELKKLICKK